MSDLEFVGLSSFVCQFGLVCNISQFESLGLLGLVCHLGGGSSFLWSHVLQGVASYSQIYSGCNTVHYDLNNQNKCSLWFCD